MHRGSSARDFRHQVLFIEVRSVGSSDLRRVQCWQGATIAPPTAGKGRQIRGLLGSRLRRSHRGGCPTLTSTTGCRDQCGGFGQCRRDVRFGCRAGGAGCHGRGNLTVRRQTRFARLGISDRCRIHRSGFRMGLMIGDSLPIDLRRGRVVGCVCGIGIGTGCSGITLRTDAEQITQYAAWSRRRLRS